MTTTLRPTPHPIRDAALADEGRRSFVRQLALGATALGTLPLAACGGSDSEPEVKFLHGVASGDPLSDRIVLWTRVTPPAGHTADIPVQWEVATDAAFGTIVAKGQASATTAGPSRKWMNCAPEK